MKKIIIKKSKGVTLIEIIIYMGVLAVVLIAITDLAVRLTFTQKSNNQISASNDNAQFVTNKLVDAISNASSLEGNYPSNELNLIVENKLMRFFLEDGVLKLSENGLEGVSISTAEVTVEPQSADQLVFDKVVSGAAQSVEIIFKIKQKDNNQTQSIQTAVMLRNKL